MPTISTIRRATSDDRAAVAITASRFATRHGLAFSGDEFDTAEDAIRYATEQDDRLRSLWVACYCRALRVPRDARTTIYGGYVGVATE